MGCLSLILFGFPISTQTLQICAFIAGVLILTIHFRMRLKARAKQKAAGSPFPAPASSAITFPASAVKTPSVSEVRAMANELNQLVVELHETSRIITAQIDNRVTKLNLLIVEADDKIKHLERLQTGPATPVIPSTSTLPPSANAPQTPGGAGSHPDPESPPHPNAAARRVPSITPHFPLPSAQAAAQRRIYDLADEGRTPREIAQALNASPGEVELILNLREQSRT